MRKTLITLFVSVVFIAGLLLIISAAHYKEDAVRTLENARRIYAHLEKYKEEYGKYPEQQDTKTLLKTLDMDNSKFSNVHLFDINSAVYHAPTQDSEGPVLTMRIKYHPFDKDRQIVIKKDYCGIEDVKKGISLRK